MEDSGTQVLIKAKRSGTCNVDNVQHDGTPPVKLLQSQDDFEEIAAIGITAVECSLSSEVIGKLEDF